MENNKVKILKLPQKTNNLVSEDDIVHLFFALVKLIKRNAQYEANKNIVNKLKELGGRIKNLEEELKVRDKIIASLKEI